MKVLCLLCSVLAMTQGFSPSSMAARRSTSTALDAASSFGPSPKNDWSGKPVTHKGDHVTTPVASPNEASWLEKKTMGDVMIEPNYFLTYAMFILGAAIIGYHPSYAEHGPSVIGIAGGTFHMLFGALLWVQTRRVRCVFEKDAFEFYNIKGPKLDLDQGAWLEKKPSNYVSGTRNRWHYDKIINYGYFPSMEFPVICYFKETETPKEQWGKWFAAFDSYGLGQPHFFPGIVNVQQFNKQMEARGVKHKPIPTLKSTAQAAKNNKA